MAEALKKLSGFAGVDGPVLGIESQVTSKTGGVATSHTESKDADN